MTKIDKPGHELARVPTDREVPVPGERAPDVAGRGARLIADLSDLFTRRKHGRGNAFLPLVRQSRFGD